MSMSVPRGTDNASLGKWAETLRSHMDKQICVHGKASITMAGMIVEVRLVGETWLWTVTLSDQPAFTALASGCEKGPQDATRKASAAMARLLKTAGPR